MKTSSTNNDFIDLSQEPHENVEEQIEEIHARRALRKKRKSRNLRIFTLFLSILLVILIMLLLQMVYTHIIGVEASNTAVNEIQYISVPQTPPPTSSPIASSQPKYFKPQLLDEHLFEIVVEECTKLDIPVNFVLAIMKTETQDFNIHDTSYNNNGTYDSGLMQINSSNIKHFSERYNLPEFTENPYDPENNIRIGIRHLAENYHIYYDQYGGDVIKTILATAGSYNRGKSSQDKYKNVYEYNARVYAHYQNLEADIDENINYQSDIPVIKEWLQNNISLG